MAKKTNEIHISTVKDASGIKLKEGRRQSVVYIPVYEGLKKLAPGAAMLVDIPKNVPVRQMHNRLNGALKRFDIKAITPKDHTLSRRTNDAGDKIVLQWASTKAKK